MKMQTLAGLAILTSLAVAAAGPVRSASLVIDDTVADPNIKFTVGGFLLDSSGNSLGVQDLTGEHFVHGASGSVTVSENGIGVAGAQEILFGGDFPLGGQTLTPKSETVFLTEGNGPDISDVITYNYSVIQQTLEGGVSGVLLSDTGTPFTVAELNGIGIRADRTVSENGSFSFDAANITSTFTSDLDAGPRVPELATWGMMIVGFAALGFSAFRRRAARLAAG